MLGGTPEPPFGCLERRIAQRKCSGFSGNVAALAAVEVGECDVKVLECLLGLSELLTNLRQM